MSAISGVHQPVLFQEYTNLFYFRSTPTCFRSTPTCFSGVHQPIFRLPVYGRDVNEDVRPWILGKYQNFPEVKTQMAKG